MKQSILGSRGPVLEVPRGFRYVILCVFQVEYTFFLVNTEQNGSTVAAQLLHRKVE